MTTIPTETQTWDERLLNILQQQQALLTRLAHLAQRQGELIRDNRTDALLTLLGERQQIIDRFLAMQHDLGDLTEKLDQRLQEIQPHQREQIERLIHEIGQSLDAVMKHDERDRHALESARNETREEISGLGTANRARQAYLGAAGANAKFADRQG